MKRTILAVTLACGALNATAEPVKCVDANGKVRYLDSSAPGTENCKPIANVTGFLGYCYGCGYDQNWTALGYPAAAPFDGTKIVDCQSQFGFTDSEGHNFGTVTPIRLDPINARDTPAPRPAAASCPCPKRRARHPCAAGSTAS